ncbi:MAG: hypothetical protein ACOX4G_14000 [Limnochordia bacterium]|jgi:hypothetical protein
MRALVVYSAVGRMALLAQALGRGLRTVGYDVQLLEAQDSAIHFSAAPFDLVCVGSPVIGFFGGAIADDIGQMLKRLSRLEGKACVAFVRPKLLWGNARSLRLLMAELEKQGALVQDFAAVSRPVDAENLGKRLANIVGN